MRTLTSVPVPPHTAVRFGPLSFVAHLAETSVVRRPIAEVLDRGGHSRLDRSLAPSTTEGVLRVKLPRTSSSQNLAASHTRFMPASALVHPESADTWEA